MAATIPTDVLCDLSTGDRVVQLDRAPGTTSGRRAIAQFVLSRLRRWVGEHRLNDKSGTDWRQLMSKPADVPRSEAHLRRVLTGVQGVISVAKLRLTFTRTSRVATLAATLNTVDGPVKLSAVLDMTAEVTILLILRGVEGIWPA